LNGPVLFDKWCGARPGEIIGHSPAAQKFFPLMLVTAVAQFVGLFPQRSLDSQAANQPMLRRVEFFQERTV
jgi:hypothetical protein